MRSGYGGLLLLNLAALSQAVEMQISTKDYQKCSGMYSRRAWGGRIDPFILTKFTAPPAAGIPKEQDPVVSMLIFEWGDRNSIQLDDLGNAMLCDKHAVDTKLCSDKELGNFILAENATEASRNEMLTQPIHLKSPPAVRYAVQKTGYYCIVTSPFEDPNLEFKAVAEFRNSFGELPAAQIPKLPFYAASMMVYTFLAVAWAVLYYLHRHDILPVQNYITAILFFLVIEMFMTWLFYDYQNRHGMTMGAKALLGAVSVLNAARVSFSLFLLLVVCLGYGVIKPSLGKTMTYVRILAAAHFVFGVIYAIASLTITPEDAGLIALLVVLPLTATLTIFYVWTLNSLSHTLKDLALRKQTVKAGMYRKLWWCILSTILTIFAFFFINSLEYAGTSGEDFAPETWQTRWFTLDGWLNLVYLFDVAFIAYIWRPTANNRRFAMSEELAQEDEGFEIASITDSLDIDLDDPEADGGLHHKPPVYGTQSLRCDRDQTRRDASPLPAPVPKKPAAPKLPRESLEGGETIFALGEEDEQDEYDEDRQGAGETARLAGEKRD
ncbi:integral membrane protein Ptm1 [Piedraia hortae CBS 480.64]|uniref:Integral membrane protein Ptm1 n=1 Tax=Piedraia hortae CBS 480.64 TaxID=1314780 RepID=A0A6A7BY40_9PEZI|nr:integral membrane protein Ptm1 [Piedraia hortae CBS 480.64]